MQYPSVSGSFFIKASTVHETIRPLLTYLLKTSFTFSMKFSGWTDVVGSKKIEYPLEVTWMVIWIPDWD